MKNHIPTKQSAGMSAIRQKEFTVSKGTRPTKTISAHKIHSSKGGTH